MRRLTIVRLRSSGFTAIEMMVVVTILAILAALAAPSFRDIVARYRVRSAAEDLTAVIYFARTEGIKRGGKVSFTRVASASGCTASAIQDWKCGWVVFVDANENGEIDAEDEVLQSSPAPAHVDVKANPGGTGVARFNVDRWGRLNSADGVGIFSFRFLPSNSSSIDLSMGLCMSSGGLLRTIKGAEACS